MQQLLSKLCLLLTCQVLYYSFCELWMTVCLSLLYRTILLVLSFFFIVYTTLILRILFKYNADSQFFFYFYLNYAVIDTCYIII